MRRRQRRAAAPCGLPITLLACAVIKPGMRVTKVHIDDRLGKRFAKRWLPDAMVLMDAVPKTDVGEFDK
jgi:fatty-acyl-CoA synthase